MADLWLSPHVAHIPRDHSDSSASSLQELTLSCWRPFCPCSLYREAEVPERHCIPEKTYSTDLCGSLTDHSLPQSGTNLRCNLWSRVHCGIWDSEIMGNFSLACLVPPFQSCFLHFLTCFSREHFLNKCQILIHESSSQGQLLESSNWVHAINTPTFNYKQSPEFCKTGHPRITKIWEEKVCTSFLVPPPKSRE